MNSFISINLKVTPIINRYRCMPERIQKSGFDSGVEDAKSRNSNDIRKPRLLTSILVSVFFRRRLLINYSFSHYRNDMAGDYLPLELSYFRLRVRWFFFVVECVVGYSKLKIIQSHWYQDYPVISLPIALKDYVATLTWACRLLQIVILSNWP